MPRQKGEQLSEYDTDGSHSYCRNPSGEQETIWCYSGNPNNPTIELCDPIGSPELETINMCGYGDESLKGTNDMEYSGC